MDFFEVLIILVFVLIPILEGVFKQRRKKELPGGGAPAPQRREPASVGAGQESGRGTGTGAEGPASDMVPADLWEVLTGERRPQAPPTEAPPWETEEWADEEVGTDEIGGTAIEEGWVSAPWEAESREPVTEPQYREPVSLEYVGPEAISLEQPLPPAEVRHEMFHDKYDDVFAAPPVAGRRGGGMRRDLRAGLQGAGLRRSILLAEILRPPKGLV